MVPGVGESEHGAPAWELYSVLYSVTYPYLLGSVFFTIGCYLAWVEVINANLQVAVERGEVSPRGSVHRQETLDFPLPISRDGGNSGGGSRGPRASGASSDGGEGADLPYLELQSRMAEILRPAPRPTSLGQCVCGLHWWGYQPRSPLYVGASAQLLGAFCFNVSCVYGLPHMTSTHLQEALLVYLTCLLGSFGFVAASYVYVLEASHSSSLRWLSEEAPTLGYALTLINL